MTLPPITQIKGVPYEKQKLGYEYLATPTEKRERPLSVWRKKNKINRTQWSLIKEQFSKDAFNADETERLRRVIANAHPLWGGVEIKPTIERPKKEKTLDPVEYLRSKLVDIIDATYESAMKGNSASQKLLFQMLGLLVEKQETKVKHEFDLAAAIKKAREELGRVGQVPDVPSVLLPGVRETSGQGTDGDNQVSVMASPDKSA